MPGWSLSYKKEAQGDATTVEGKVTTEQRCFATSFAEGGRGHQSRNAAGKGKETDGPCSPRKDSALPTP